jgi:hypothetical protein
MNPRNPCELVAEPMGSADYTQGSTEMESITVETDCLLEENIAIFFGLLSSALSGHTWEHKISILTERVLLVSRMWLQCKAEARSQLGVLQKFASNKVPT